MNDPYRNQGGLRFIADVFARLRSGPKTADLEVPPPAPAAAADAGVTVITRPTMATAAGKLIGDYWRNNGWVGRIAKAALVTGIILVASGIVATSLGTATPLAMWALTAAVGVGAINEVRVKRKEMVRDQIAWSERPPTLGSDVLPDTPGTEDPGAPTAEAPTPVATTPEPVAPTVPSDSVVTPAPTDAGTLDTSTAAANPHPIKGRNLTPAQLHEVRSDIAKTRFWRLQATQAETYREQLAKIVAATTPREARALAGEAVLVRSTDAVRCRENIAYRSAFRQIAELAKDARSLDRAKKFAGEVLSIYAADVSVAATGAAPTAEHSSRVAARAIDVGSVKSPRLASVIKQAIPRGAMTLN